MNDLHIESITHDGDKYYRISPMDVDLSKMEQAQKVTDIIAFQVKKGHEQDIITRSGGVEETANHASAGDWIVFNIGNAAEGSIKDKIAEADVKVIKEEDFPKLYKISDDHNNDDSDYSDYDPIFQGAAYQNPSVYHYIGKPIYVANVPFNFVIHAPWGQDQFIKKGGYLVYNPNTSRDGRHDIYGIQGTHHKAAGQFEKTYTKIGDGNYDAIEDIYKFVIACDRSPISGIQFNMADLQRAYDRIGKDIQQELNV